MNVRMSFVHVSTVHYVQVYGSVSILGVLTGESVSHKTCIVVGLFKSC